MSDETLLGKGVIVKIRPTTVRCFRNAICLGFDPSNPSKEYAFAFTDTARTDSTIDGIRVAADNLKIWPYNRKVNIVYESSNCVRFSRPLIEEEMVYFENYNRLMREQREH